MNLKHDEKLENIQKGSKLEYQVKSDSTVTPSHVKKPIIRKKENISYSL